MSKKQGNNAKYLNKTITIDGIKFDSKDESLYYLLLKEKKEKREIIDFSLQPKYELIPKFSYFGENRRAVTYTPDFRVEYPNGETQVIDVKSMGTATQQGELRRKLFEWRYPEEKLVWLCRNIKHGDEDGWITYEALKKIYRDKKKEKSRDEK